MLFFHTSKAEKFNVISSKLLLEENQKNLMKSLLGQKRVKAIFGIAMVPTGIGSLSKRVISYPVEGCVKESQELTFKKEMNNYLSSK